MPLIRPALPMLAAILVLTPAGTAEAASSKLTPTPPVALTQPPRSQATATTSGTGAIPRTGNDLVEQMLVAGAMIAAGAAVRTRRLSGPR